MTYTIDNVAVLGAGLMGHALALIHALGGRPVALQDVSEKALAKAPGLIDAAFATLIEAGETTAAEAKAAAARIRYGASRDDAVRDADLIVEAVVEDPGVKREVLAGIDRVAKPSALIASNTSYLDVFPLSPPSRARTTLVAHWYTPPYIVDLVDLVGSERTDPAAIETLRGLYSGWGKKPVVMKRFIPGYIANRIQAAITNEVFRLIDEGYASPQDVDDAVIHGLSLRLPLLGHIKKADFTGLELVQRALANKTWEPAPVTGRSPTVDRLIAEGRTGVMAGKGFFDYTGRSPDELFRERDRRLLSLKRHLRKLGDI